MGEAYLSRPGVESPFPGSTFTAVASHIARESKRGAFGTFLVSGHRREQAAELPFWRASCSLHAIHSVGVFNTRRNGNHGHGQAPNRRQPQGHMMNPADCLAYPRHLPLSAERPAP